MPKIGFSSPDTLCALSFRTPHLNDALTRWRLDHPVMMAESCARQVWVCTPETAASLPDLPRGNAFQKMSGQAAYHFLLRLLTGMDSQKKGETNINGQFFQGWEKFLSDHPVASRGLSHVIQDVKTDARHVSNIILSQHKVRRHEIAARDLSGQSKGETALIIASEGRYGGASIFSKGIAQVIGNNRKGRVRDIVITHPDNGTLETLYREFKSMVFEKKISAGVGQVRFEDLSPAFEICDRVYSDLCMGTDEDHHKYIIETWRQRERRDNTITTLRGNSEKQGQSSGVWLQSGIDNWISAEQIREEMTARGAYNLHLEQKSEEVFAFCARTRASGKAVSERMVKDFLQTLDRQEMPKTACSFSRTPKPCL